MLCQNCHKKTAVVHMITMVNDKASDKWLCEDCASAFLTPGMGTRGSAMSPEKALKFLQNLLGVGTGDAVNAKPKGKDGFSSGATKVL